MKYSDEIIHFIGGIHEYLGRLGEGEHPMGDDWFSIKDPCLTWMHQNEAEKRLDTVVASLWGPHKVYRRYVNFRIPPECPIEIRELDKNGSLYGYYQKTINMPTEGKIILPTHGIATA